MHPVCYLYMTPSTHGEFLKGDDGPSRSYQVFDWNNTTGKKTCQAGFRIFAEQKEHLDQEYPGNGSALVRFLLDKYITGELPEMKEQFKQYLLDAKVVTIR
jgi:hypothetical protein